MNWDLGSLNWSILILIVFALWIVESGMTMIQVGNFQKTLRNFVDLEKGDYIGVGSQKGYLKSGTVVIMATNKKGEITYLEKMQGVTVFTRFHEWESLYGINVYDLANDKFSDIKMSTTCRKALKKAAKLIVEKMAEKKEETYH